MATSRKNIPDYLWSIRRDARKEFPEFDKYVLGLYVVGKKEKPIFVLAIVVLDSITESKKGKVGNWKMGFDDVDEMLFWWDLPNIKNATVSAI
jgi:hypothetical protein